jgi:hypothetical protein
MILPIFSTDFENRKNRKNRKRNGTFQEFLENPKIPDFDPSLGFIY